MRFGVAIRSSLIPELAASERGGELRRLALAAEESGFDSIWVPDRTVFPTDIATRYPGQFGAPGSTPDSQQVLEPVTAMSFLAGSTSRIRLDLHCARSRLFVHILEFVSGMPIPPGWSLIPKNSRSTESSWS